GAGPGDPELLTLKAVRAIRAATVLLVDDLVNEACLRYARRSARIVYVGKRGGAQSAPPTAPAPPFRNLREMRDAARAGCRSTPQAFIEHLMVREALAGETVVRLKGGDPLLFGRAGEELAALRAAGVQVEVINGVTAALGAAQALGTSLTHRDHAHGVIFVTGHAKGADAQIDWAQLAQTAAQGFTLVIYMGMGELAALQAALRAALPGDTPAAVVQHATLPGQRVVQCTLDSLAATVARDGLGSPAVLIVGQVLEGTAALARPAAAWPFGT
ncbi:MAG: uroporphyrinogen-III C-methyltransferase, partial [Betaproteobacteria bacterium]|nr:uroporphyrinogen-III C-methyltransferase [Betaproteobacteria bacterium]